MDIIMPKKTKSSRKPRRALKLKTPRRPRKHAKQLSLRTIKTQLTDTIEQLIVNVDPQHQHDVVEHLCDIGIDMLGLVTGVDATNAIVVFPDDNVARLLELIHLEEQATQVPSEAIIEGLIKQLTDAQQARMN